MAALRDAEVTRQKILEISADEITRRGYGAASLSDILTRAGISKGALYHHFPSKQELGYAVFEEVYAPQYLGMWGEALTQPDPLVAFCSLLEQMPLRMDEDQIACGCPVTNISLEMSAVDEGFRLRTASMQREFSIMMLKALERGIELGQIRPGLNLPRTAWFIVAATHGFPSVVKTSRDIEMLKELTSALRDYVQSLRP